VDAVFMKLQTKFYSFLLRNLQKKVQKHQSLGKDRITFLAYTLMCELENQGYKLDSHGMKHVDINIHEGNRLYIENIINGVEVFKKLD
jgi:hypothetical protein